MKSIAKLIASCLFAGALVSCGGGSSSSGCFGSIPSEIQKFQEKDKNSRDDSGREKAAAKIEKMAIALNGKELQAEAGQDLKIAEPLSLEFRSMNGVRPVVNFNGVLEADKDFKLNISESDLAERQLLGGAKIVIKVRMAVAMDCLSKDGTVIKTYSDLGTLAAENLKTEAVVKSGTKVEFNTFCIMEDLAGTESLHFYIAEDQAPYTDQELVRE